SLGPGGIFSGQSARDRALELFARLKVWDTRANNGVLLYLLLAEHRIELVADRGFDGMIDAAQWRDACGLICHQLQTGHPEAALVMCCDALAMLLAGPFSAMTRMPCYNELL